MLPSLRDPAAREGPTAQAVCLPAAGRTIQAGDLVIVYENPHSMKAEYVNPAKSFDTRFGSFPQKEWIGLPFGGRALSKAQRGGERRGWVHLLAPTPELWTLVLKHRTQILYIADISMVGFHLDLRPGSVVLETGTGSGSLTHSLIRAVAPTGHVHTFEFHPQRAADAAAEFAKHGLASCVTTQQRNIEELGFPEELSGCADGVFLDLPGPHKVVPSAAKCLKPDGRFCSFSPCIEQIQRTAEALVLAGFVDLRTLEVILHEHEVHDERLITDLAIVRPPPRGTKRQRDAAATSAAAAAASAAAAAAAAASSPAVAADAAVAAAAGSAGSDVAVDDAPAVQSSPSACTEVPTAAPPASVLPAPAATPAAGGTASGTGAKPAGHARVSWAAGTKPPPQQQLSRMTVSRPAMEARGHTGYLIFARKFVVL